MITADNLSGTLTLRHGFFTRDGGVSEGIFSSLNCGYGSGDDAENVRQNRENAMSRISSTADVLTTAYQVHSSEVAVVEKLWSIDNRPQVDALVTQVPGIALGIMTADCAPVLFADAEAGVIGAAHAGWKGALGGVLQATIDTMEELGGARSRIIAALGPCIRQQSYEVGPEFKASFITVSTDYETYFLPADRQTHFMFDLATFIMDRLQSLNLASVEDVGVDTYEESNRFFSYRRATHKGEADYGRGLSALVMETN